MAHMNVGLPAEVWNRMLGTHLGSQIAEDIGRLLLRPAVLKPPTPALMTRAARALERLGCPRHPVRLFRPAAIDNAVTELMRELQPSFAKRVRRVVIENLSRSTKEGPWHDLALSIELEAELNALAASPWSTIEHGVRRSLEGSQWERLAGTLPGTAWIDTADLMQSAFEAVVCAHVGWSISTAPTARERLAATRELLVLYAKGNFLVGTFRGERRNKSYLVAVD